ncbi:uncharacterized protein LOC125757432 [Rhipicephalus sanguineus]|uniref:uncharacterized protein LOC125757432 n=1 Tax=Rhipicephalus sanguineus TaxID=34632 RepID=UPI0020C2D3A2|nr:uncharacterized protein LOC125757432 [Rhipicephalus sanguineus]
MCAIFGFSSRSDTRGTKRSTNGHFFSIPKTVHNQCERSKALSTKRRSLWLARIKRADLEIENPNLRVCGVHFITGKPAKLIDDTDPDWAPSLLLGYSAQNTDPSRRRRLEKRRAVKRQADAEKWEAEAQKRRAEAEAAAIGIQQCANRQLSPHPTGETDADESDTGVTVQTEMTMEDIQLLEQQCISLNERFYAARVEKEELVESAASLNINNSLSKFQEFILFMMKIKVNIHNTDLVFRLNISEATASRIFDKWLHGAYCELPQI